MALLAKIITAGVCFLSLEAFTEVDEEEMLTQKTYRELQFENEQVKVWKTVITPNDPLKMHRHDQSRVVIGLKGGTLKRIAENGDAAELVFETGKAYWLTEDPPGEFHGDINESDEPIEVMVVEMKIKPFQ